MQKNARTLRSFEKNACPTLLFSQWKIRRAGHPYHHPRQHVTATMTQSQKMTLESLSGRGEIDIQKGWRGPWVRNDIEASFHTVPPSWWQRRILYDALINDEEKRWRGDADAQLWLYGYNDVKWSDLYPSIPPQPVKMRYTLCPVTKSGVYCTSATSLD